LAAVVTSLIGIRHVLSPIYNPHKATDLGGILSDYWSSLNSTIHLSCARVATEGVCLPFVMWSVLCIAEGYLGIERRD